MAEWAPSLTEVRGGEVVGRRIFDKSDSVTPEIEKVSKNLFFDTRLADDLSFDRLGEGNFDRRIVGRLTALSDEAAAAQKENFNGWLTIQYKKLKFGHMRPDPLTLAVHGVDNPFHALLSRELAREKSQAFHLSRSLLMAFQEEGQVVPPARRKLRSPEIGDALEL